MQVGNQIVVQVGSITMMKGDLTCTERSVDQSSANVWVVCSTTSNNPAGAGILDNHL